MSLPRRRKASSSISSGRNGQAVPLSSAVQLCRVVLPFDNRQAQTEAAHCLTYGSRPKIAYLDGCQVCRLCQHNSPVDYKWIAGALYNPEADLCLEGAIVGAQEAREQSTVTSDNYGDCWLKCLKEEPTCRSSRSKAT